jgi:diketogulonate reductase-like aldo/keto reductase
MALTPSRLAINEQSMKTRTFGSTHKAVPIIGQGTWNFPQLGPGVEAAKLALRQGIELGMIHIDTAEMYGSGRSEEIIGEAIQGLPREKLFIVSKVLPSNATYKGTIKACESSLKRLKTDYMDCFLLHWRGSNPLEETMRAMEQLVSDGKIRSLGVSNFNVDDLEEARGYLHKEKIACNQVLYNLGERGIERRLIPYCEKHEIAVVGYTPFGHMPAASSAGGKVLTELAKKHNSTERQIVLSFLVRMEILFAIPKASNPDHVRENAGAAKFKLQTSDIDAIDAISPAPSKDVPLATG